MFLPACILVFESTSYPFPSPPHAGVKPFQLVPKSVNPRRPEVVPGVRNRLGSAPTLHTKPQFIKRPFGKCECASGEAMSDVSSTANGKRLSCGEYLQAWCGCGLERYALLDALLLEFAILRPEKLRSEQFQNFSATRFSEAMPIRGENFAGF